MAAAPTAPSLAFGGSSVGGARAGEALSLVDHHTDPILLHRGTTSPSVAQVQRALHITVDGIFGPETEAAVRAFQQEHGLAITGKVDVKTWLTLFPHDTVIATPTGWSANTGPAPAVTDASYVSSAGAPAATADSASAGAQTSPAPSGGKSGGSGDATVTAAAFHPSAGSANGNGGDPAFTPSAAGTSGSSAPSNPAPADPSVSTGVTGGFSGGGGGPAVSGPTPQITVPPHLQGTAADLIAKMIAAANRITAHHYAYQWGGGHNPSFSGPYDCSGAVSAVLHAAGLLRAPMVSGDFVHWGAPGPGAVTIYANATHVYMSINGHFFGTSGSNPGGGAAWFNGAPRPGFAVVHVPFERMHLRPSARVRAAKVRVRRGARVHAATNSYASDGGTPGPAASAAASDSSQQPTYDQAPPPPPPSSGGGTQSSSDASSGGSPSSDAAPASGGSSTTAASESAPATSAPLSSSSGGSDATTSSVSDATPAASTPSRDATAVSSETSAAPTHVTETHSLSSDTSGPAEPSHVTVSSDGGSASSAGADSAPKAPAGSAGGSSSSGDGAGLGHGASGGSSSVVKASDG